MFHIPALIRPGGEFRSALKLEVKKLTVLLKEGMRVSGLSPVNIQATPRPAPIRLIMASCRYHYLKEFVLFTRNVSGRLRCHGALQATIHLPIHGFEHLIDRS